MPCCGQRADSRVDVVDREDRELGVLTTKTDSGNSQIGVSLSSGSTWTGTWVDCNGYAQVVTSFQSTQAGTFALEFSSDAATAQRVFGPYELPANTENTQVEVPTRRYYRAKYTNTSVSSATINIETRLSATFGLLKSHPQDSLSGITVATVSRSVLFGANENGMTYGNVGITERGALEVESIGPLSAFGETVVSALDARIQTDAVYGLLTLTDHETFSATGGSVAATNSLFTCQTGTSVGGFGVIRTRRLIRYRAGQGVRIRFTAKYTAGVANSQQLAGGFTATDGLFFGYSGATFGILRRIAGAVAIHRLTINTGAGGAETVTITLNGTAFNIPTGGALTTTALAEFIAESGVFTGWTNTVSPTSNGATVTFLQNVPAATAGAFTLTSTGTAAGTFATVQAGAANDDTTGFVAQTAWNVDTLDGGDDAANPSGMLLDPTKLNVYEIVFPYLGAGTIRFRVMTPGGRFVTVHRIEYPNSATIPNQRNPTLRLGWIAASLGSTTNLTVQGASAAGFLEGPATETRDPFGTSTNNFTAGTTEYVALAIRVGAVFGTTAAPNQREVRPRSISVGTETSNRVVRVRCLLNPTLTGTVNWGYVDSARSCVEVATPTTLTPSGGSEVGFDVAPSGAPAKLDLSSSSLRLEPGDVLVIALITATGSATTAVAINWSET